MKKEEFTIRSLYADDCLDRGPRSQPIQDVSNSHTLNRPCDPEPAANESAARLDKARATDLYIFNFAVRQCSQDLGPTAGDYQKLVLKEGHIIPMAHKDRGDWNMTPEIYNIVHGDQGGASNTGISGGSDGLPLAGSTSRPLLPSSLMILLALSRCRHDHTVAARPVNPRCLAARDPCKQACLITTDLSGRPESCYGLEAHRASACPSAGRRRELTATPRTARYTGPPAYRQADPLRKPIFEAVRHGLGGSELLRPT